MKVGTADGNYFSLLSDQSSKKVCRNKKRDVDIRPTNGSMVPDQDTTLMDQHSILSII